jgi:hypothetical protein
MRAEIRSRHVLKGLSWKNAIAYFDSAAAMKKKKFNEIDTGSQYDNAYFLCH